MAHYMGIIAPTGLVTDYTYRDFFAHLVDERRLAATYDFENRRKLFPEVDSRFRFVTLVTTAPGGPIEARFAFMIHDPAELDAADRSYTLTPEQIALVNPNTKTAPVFLSPRDAEITTRIYERHPVLIHQGRDDGNPWGVRFGTMFHMTNDADLFKTTEQLDSYGWKLRGNVFERNSEQMVPLFEGRFGHMFDHRFAQSDVNGGEMDCPKDPTAIPMPHVWVPDEEAKRRSDGAEFQVGFRRVARSNDMRTIIACAIPQRAISYGNILTQDVGLRERILLLACYASFAFDFLARQKLTQASIPQSTFEQLPVPHPNTFIELVSWDAHARVGDWIASRSSGLSATDTALAGAMGYSTPVIWDDEQREMWRTELDAAMFHIYGYSRDEIAYVMETFPIVARKDRQAEGLADDDPNWRTKRLILAKYDELAEHARTGTTYVSPAPPPPLPEKLQLPATTVAADA